MTPQTPPGSTIQDWTQTAMDATKAAALQEVTLLNNNLQTQYLQGFNNWAQAVILGKIPNTNPPQPPTGYGCTVGDDGWATIVKTSDPVCAMPPVPAAPPVWQPPAIPEPDNVRNVPPGDTMPVGYVLTAADGSRWQKQASPTPFGVEYYYARM